MAMEQPSDRLAMVVSRQVNDSLPDMNATQSVIDGLVFKYNVQNRTSVVVTASFSVAASTIVILSILYDARRFSQRSYQGRPRYGFYNSFQPKSGDIVTFLRRIAGFLSRVRPAHVFPLAVSIGVVVQGVIFLAVSSIGLKKMFASDCEEVSQIVWPGESSSLKGLLKLADFCLLSRLDSWIHSVSFQFRNSIQKPEVASIFSPREMEHARVLADRDYNACLDLDTIKSAAAGAWELSCQPFALGIAVGRYCHSLRFELDGIVLDQRWDLDISTPQCG